jgi:hypothetical protein
MMSAPVANGCVGVAGDVFPGAQAHARRSACQTTVPAKLTALNQMSASGNLPCRLLGDSNGIWKGLPFTTGR